MGPTATMAAVAIVTVFGLLLIGSLDYYFVRRARSEDGDAR